MLLCVYLIGLVNVGIQFFPFVDGREYAHCYNLVSEGAEVLARYTEDFYAGMPALTANGYGKRILLTDIPLRMNRGSSGVKTMSHMDRNGKLVGVVRSDINSDYLVITDLGHMTRTPVSNLPLPGRTAGGVIVMRPYEGESIIALQSIPENVVASNEHTRNARNLDKNDELEIIEKLNGGKDKDAEETSKEDI